MQVTQVVISSKDGHIWNRDSVCADIVYAMCKDQDLVLNFENEAPCLRDLGFYDFLESWCDRIGYDPNRVTIFTGNQIENHDRVSVRINNIMHLHQHAQDFCETIDITKSVHIRHFGLFVGRSNAPRLLLASYLWKTHLDKCLMTYHFNHHDDFHLSNIGLDDMISRHSVRDVSDAARFLSQCPMGVSNDPGKVDKSNFPGLSHQLVDQDRSMFGMKYQNFLIELVCESYFSGDTFFVTEKTWRPIMLKTPFIAQGPRYFLTRLKDLGFRTFDQWWDEGYQEDPWDCQITQIMRIVDELARLDQSQLQSIYREMQPILEHNQKRFFELTAQDFERMHHDCKK